MKCRIDGRKCEAFFPEHRFEKDRIAPDFWEGGLCPFGMYHDQNHHTQYEGRDILVYSDTCIFAEERRLPPKELRDRPLFSWRQIRVMLNQLSEEANDVEPVERDV